MLASSMNQLLVRGLRRIVTNDFRRSISGQEKTTHFGFETVTEEEKLEKVKDVFSKVADSYDLMNDVMSAGIHRWWKKRFIEKLDPYPGTQLLDVAGGTGDIAFRFLDHVAEANKLLGNTADQSKVTICDINENMLRVGEQRAAKRGLTAVDPIYGRNRIEWVAGDAMRLPFANESFDAYTIAFGIRNVVDIPCALREAHRVLKPGGVFSCLEFSRVTNPFLESVYNWYSFQLIPVYGEILAGDWKSYQYLVESIRKFPDQGDFKDMIEDAGFSLVDYENLTNGVAAIHSGYKSETAPLN